MPTADPAGGIIRVGRVHMPGGFSAIGQCQARRTGEGRIGNQLRSANLSVRNRDIFRAKNRSDEIEVRTSVSMPLETSGRRGIRNTH